MYVHIAQTMVFMIDNPIFMCNIEVPDPFLAREVIRGFDLAALDVIATIPIICKIKHTFFININTYINIV